MNAQIRPVEAREPHAVVAVVLSLAVVALLGAFAVRMALDMSLDSAPADAGASP